MKTLLIIIIFTTTSFAQKDTTIFNWSNGFGSVSIGEWENDKQMHSEMRFSNVENLGDTTCSHIWIIKNITYYSNTICAVYHGVLGCPNNWDVEGRICKVCLRKEIWQEHRWLTEKPKTEYEILDGKIKKGDR